jgi:glucosamine 6-phosphate synthetase-like amidotransferase/phosphosugar isomerase protein
MKSVTAITRSEELLMDVVPFQIPTYHLALENKADPDYPRNILKAVTVKPNRALIIPVALLVTLS